MNESNLQRTDYFIIDNPVNDPPKLAIAMNTVAVSNVLHTDCLSGLRRLQAEGTQVHTVVTSPPYWGLRDYGIEGIDWPSGWHGVWGLEPTFAQYIENTVAVFELLRPVLRDDGVIWWNLGDSYYSGNRTDKPGARKSAKNKPIHVRQPNRTPQSVPVGSKLLLPHRVAIALADAGWCVRQDNIWSKRSPMPESLSGWRWIRCRRKTGQRVAANGGLASWDMGEHAHGPSGRYAQEKTVPEYEECSGCRKCADNDGYVLRRGRWRCTTAHEYVFQVTKGERYFCDGDAAAEPTAGTAHNRGHGSNPKASGPQKLNKQNRSFSSAVSGLVDVRNPRSVWTLSTESYKGAHFATFPTAIPRRCIQASTSSAGVCPECGSQWAPVVLTSRQPTRPGANTKVQKADVAAATGACRRDQPSAIGNRDPQRHVTTTVVQEYRQTCDCPFEAPVPATVLDLCSGSATTGAVCRELHRSYIGFEVNADYIALGQARMENVL